MRADRIVRRDQWEPPTDEVEDFLQYVSAGDQAVPVASLVQSKDRRLSVMFHPSLPKSGRVRSSGPGRRPAARDLLKGINGGGRAMMLLFVCGSLAAGAQAAVMPTVRCRYDSRLTGNPGPIRHLQIAMQAKRVDNYLTRCQLASFVAGDANGRRRVLEQGARWRVGWFTCTYRNHRDSVPDETVISTRCEHSGRYRSVVWFDAYA